MLKSPPHTGRVKVLLEMFPDAKFVHIVRDPFVIFPSTVHLWKTLYSTQGMQKPRFEGLDEYVLANFDADVRTIRDRSRVDSRRQLLRDSLRNARRRPDRGNQAGLRKARAGGFDEALPALEDYVKATKGYETNKYRELAPELREAIIDRAGAAISRKYGYAREVAGQRTAAAEQPTQVRPYLSMAPATKPSGPRWLLRRADQAAVGGLVALALVAMGLWWLAQGGCRRTAGRIRAAAGAARPNFKST